MGNTTSKRRANTAHSLTHLRADGYFATVVERWVSSPITPGTGDVGSPGIRQDLLGIIDILAIRPGEILGVQVGSRGGHSGHRCKILAEPRTWDWIGSGARLTIHSWDQVELPTLSPEAINGTKTRWRLKEEEILPAHLSLDEGKIADAVLQRWGYEVSS
jgi:hypothetical protein